MSLTDYEKYVDRDICAIPDIIKFRREENWTALQVISKNVLEKHQSNISSFYKTRISVPPSKTKSHLLGVVTKEHRRFVILWEWIF